MALCRKCSLVMMRKIFGEDVREVCRNPRCAEYGVPQGALVAKVELTQEDPGAQEQEEPTETSADGV